MGRGAGEARIEAWEGEGLKGRKEQEKDFQEEGDDWSRLRESSKLRNCV
jgi:hypothetical protein